MNRNNLFITTLAACLAIFDCSASEPTRIFLAGDSTMAEKLPEKRPETGWGEKLQGWFPEQEVVVVNHAKNGRSTRTFIEEGRWQKLLEEVRPGDYVFIQFGHNDQSEHKPGRYTPPEAFSRNLNRFVSEVDEKSAIPVLLTPVVRRRFDENGAFYETHGAYPALVRNTAATTGATLIDLQLSSKVYLESYGAERSKDLFLWLMPGEHENYPEGLEDNTHFSPYGAAAMASLVMQGIMESLPALADQLEYLPGSIQHDNDNALEESGPHQGGGQTTGHWFFREDVDPGFTFRKQVLHDGSSIGYHLHDKDEVYYVLEGKGELTFNGKKTLVGPGTAIFTRPGDSHGLKPVNGDLTVIIVYEIKDE